jgi:predicted amidophosphoribosyltransferase
VSFAVALHRIWSRAAGVESIELASILTRKRATPRLAGLSPAERAVAVADLFDVKKRRIEYLEGHNRIILVDDICTTGATAIAATCALRAIGPRDIELAVIARTLESLG